MGHQTPKTCLQQATHLGDIFWKASRRPPIWSTGGSSSSDGDAVCGARRWGQREAAAVLGFGARRAGASAIFCVDFAPTRMEHGETGEGEVPQHFFFGGFMYGMHGGSVSAGTQDCHLMPLESPLSASMSGKKFAPVKRVAYRGSAFTKEEDNVLCSAFLNVGKDPITGINQNMEGYYNRIYDYYQPCKPESSVCSQISLQKRWAIIQKAVSKFCAFKSAVG